MTLPCAPLSTDAVPSTSDTRCAPRRRPVIGPLAALSLALTATLPAVAGELTPLERDWLAGAQPVLAWARARAMPVDVVVQPQPTPGQAPLAMAYLDGRCKLVLSMRGNDEAQSTLDSLPEALRPTLIELMAAHELGHCRRYIAGQWHGLPAGFRPARTPPEVPESMDDAFQAMQAVRREEAYGDLVGLAWTRQHHTERYATAYRWLVNERAQELIPGSHHDTLSWLKDAADGAALDGEEPFGPAAQLWRHGLMPSASTERVD